MLASYCLWGESEREMKEENPSEENMNNTSAFNSYKSHKVMQLVFISIINNHITSLTQCETCVFSQS